MLIKHKNILYVIISSCCQRRLKVKGTTQSVGELAMIYDGDKNSMIAVTERGDTNLYEEFYDEFDNRARIEHSMNMIFFSPSRSFLRIDPETILHIFSHTKKHLIPITRALLAWDILTDGKTAAFLQGREYLALGSLLNVVPEEDLYYVNFGDPSVLNYFSNHYLPLERRKFGVLVAAYRRYYGNRWINNNTYINELGYLLCGFPYTDLQEIKPTTFKEINADVLSKLSRCDVKQKKTLYNIATQPEAYGAPYKWTSHEISRLGNLFACIPENDISSIRLEAISAITPGVMKIMKQEKVNYFTKQQILRMSEKTRRIFFLRLQLKNSLDMSQIARRSGTNMNSCVIFFITNLFLLHIVL